jgi:hypothetical protein
MSILRLNTFKFIIFLAFVLGLTAAQTQYSYAQSQEKVQESATILGEELKPDSLAGSEQATDSPGEGLSPEAAEDRPEFSIATDVSTSKLKPSDSEGITVVSANEDYKKTLKEKREALLENQRQCQILRDKLQNHKIDLSTAFNDGKDAENPMDFYFDNEIYSFSDINTKQNTANVRGGISLWFEWDHGPQLTDTCYINISQTKYNLSNFAFEPSNFKSIKITPKWFSLGKDNDAAILFEYTGVVRQEFNVIQFPFDTQKAQVAFDNGSSNKRSTVSLEAFFSPKYGSFYTEWVPNTKSLKHTATPDERATYTTTWEISRISAHYIFKYFTPLFLLVFLSMFSFTLPDSTSALRINGSVLFGLFSINIAGGSSLPKVGYLTFYDLIVLGEICITLLVIFMIFLWISEFKINIKIATLDFTDQSFRRKASAFLVVANILLFVVAMLLTGLL